jgi:hypothetical protein
MVRTARRCALPARIVGFLVALLAPGGLAAIDHPPKQILIDAKIVEASRRFGDEIGLFRRDGCDGAAQLLISLPAAPGGVQIDAVRLELDRRAARSLEPAVLPPGWSHRPVGPVATFSGPPTATGRLGFALELGDIELELTPKLEASAAGRIVLQAEPKIVPLSSCGTRGELEHVLRLPQSIAPGDTIEFVPLDPRTTPGGGAWTIGGLRAEWNGRFDAPGYRLKMPDQFGDKVTPESRLRVRYVDDWGFRLVDGPADDVELRTTPRPPAGEPRVRDCSKQVLDGHTFCLCGDFPPGAASELTINGKPMGQYLVSSGPTVLNFRLPGDFAPGPIEIGSRSGFDVLDGESVLIKVRAAIDRAQLQRGQSTQLELALAGTTEPVDLRLRNTTPDKVRLDGGDEVVVTTAGGERNTVQRGVHAVSPGPFQITYSLTIGSCACAENGESRIEQPPMPPPPGLGTPPPGDQIGDRIEEWNGRWRTWVDRLRQIDCRDEQVEEYVRQVSAELERLETWLAEIWPKIQQLELDASLGDDPAARRLVEAYHELAHRAESLKEHLIDILLLPRCEDVEHDDSVDVPPIVDPGDFDVVGDPPKGPPPPPPGNDKIEKKKVEPQRCGADITKAFDEAFDRVSRRIHDLPAGERGERAADFMKRNAPWGWFDEKSPVWEEPEAKDDHLLWWDAGPIVLEPCALLDSPCQGTAWLWGRCLAAEQISMLLEGLVEGMLGLPADAKTEYERSSGNPMHGWGRQVGEAAEAHRNQNGSGRWQEFRDRTVQAFNGQYGLWNPACSACEKCGLYSTIFEIDWTNEPWELSDGRFQKPDGSIVRLDDKVF